MIHTRLKPKRHTQTTEQVHQRCFTVHQGLKKRIARWPGDCLGEFQGQWTELLLAPMGQQITKWSEKQHICIVIICEGNV